LHSFDSYVVVLPFLVTVAVPLPVLYVVFCEPQAANATMESKK